MIDCSHVSNLSTYIWTVSVEERFDYAALAVLMNTHDDLNYIRFVFLYRNFTNNNNKKNIHS